MKRNQITELLTNTLIQTRLSDRKYFAREVTLDYGTSHPKRIDVMQYIPEGTTFASDIERGEFICYEIKSCKEDVYSGHGLNFYGDKNYIVTTMDVWKNVLIPDYMQSNKFLDHVAECNPDSNNNIGVMVLIPSSSDIETEFENPTLINTCADWKLETIHMSRKKGRKRSIVELLFCMLRAKHG